MGGWGVGHWMGVQPGGGGGDGIGSTTSIDVVLKRPVPLPPWLTLQGVSGFPALDSGLQDIAAPERVGGGGGG